MGTICDASFPTFYLTHWVRDRDHGRVPVETAIHWQTKRTADYMGLSDRGSLEVGKRADVNVIDLENLKLHPPKLVQDLPAGGQRLLQRADGYRATLVAGQVICKDGQLTGAMPGRVVRSGR